LPLAETRGATGEPLGHRSKLPRAWASPRDRRLQRTRPRRSWLSPPKLSRARILLGIEPGDVRRVIGETPDADVLDRAIRHLFERRVARMMRLLVRVVSRGIVAADHRPPRPVGEVPVGAVEQVRMEEEDVPWSHLAVDDLVPLEDRLDPLHVGAGLVARED